MWLAPGSRDGARTRTPSSATWSTGTGVRGRSSARARTTPAPMRHRTRRDTTWLASRIEQLVETIIRRQHSLGVDRSDGAPRQRPEHAADLLSRVVSPRAGPSISSRQFGHGQRQQRHERGGDASPIAKTGEEDSGTIERSLGPTVADRSRSSDNITMPVEEEVNRPEHAHEPRHDALREGSRR